MHYIGTKIVLAIAMNRLAYNAYRGWTLPADENGEDEGYLVEYTDGGAPNHAAHAGYISWSPKAQFDGGYTAAGDIGHLPPHVQRLAAEKAQNDDRLFKLESFFASQTFANLPIEHRLPMFAQGDVMRELSRILGERLALFGVNQ